MSSHPNARTPNRHYWWVKLISLGTNLNSKCSAERKLSDKSDKLTPHQNFFTLTLALSQSPFDFFRFRCVVCFIFAICFHLIMYAFYLCDYPDWLTEIGMERQRNKTEPNWNRNIIIECRLRRARYIRTYLHFPPFYNTQNKLNLIIKH